MHIEIPMPPAAKARPRVTSRGTYMPRKYQEWRREFVGHCEGSGQVSGPFALAVTFETKSGTMRPDLDNAAAAVLDALQDAEVIQNDRNCRRLFAEVVKAKGNRIVVDIEAA